MSFSLSYFVKKLLYTKDQWVIGKDGGKFYMQNKSFIVITSLFNFPKYTTIKTNLLKEFYSQKCFFLIKHLRQKTIRICEYP